MGADELVQEIFTIVHAVRGQDIASLSGDTLSRLVVKLASYKASLGEYAAEANRLARTAEADYKQAKVDGFKALRDEGMNSTDAKEMKDSRASDQLAAFNDALYKAELITNLSRDCHDLIDAIRGRLITLQSERTESNAY